jgi:hypothetical protein
MLIRRLAATGLATVLALSLASVPAYAASKKATPKPTPPGSARKIVAPPPLPIMLAPQIYQVNPTKVNPTTQPNIMILGQHLSATTSVQVGGRPATTVQAPDANHLLVKLPDNLAHGAYTVQVSNGAGTAVATDALEVDVQASQLSTLQIVSGAGFLLVLVLVMRLSRTPGLS